MYTSLSLPVLSLSPKYNISYVALSNVYIWQVNTAQTRLKTA